MTLQKVLVVEDDENCRKMFAEVLSVLPTEVLTASGYVEGMNHLRSMRSVDVILADHHLLNGRGLDLLKEASKRDVGGVLITGHPSKDLTDAATAGGWVVLEKPIPVDRLRAHVANLLSCAALTDSRED